MNAYFISDSIPSLIDAGFYSDVSLNAVKSAAEKEGCRVTDIKRKIELISINGSWETMLGKFEFSMD